MSKLVGVVLVLALVDTGLAENLIRTDRPKVRVRADATVQSPQVAELSAGEIVEKVGKKDEWYEIILPDGTTGWVNSYLMLDVNEISIGIGLDQRIGDRFLRAGPGYGGSCFPKDTRALLNTGKKFKTELSIVNTVVRSNDNRHKIITSKISNNINNKLKNKKITFLGVTFKAGTDDMRESPSLKIIPTLIKKGSLIKYYDPTGSKKEFNKFKNINYCSNIKEACKNSDLLVIHTEWNEFKQLNFKNIVKKKNFKIYDMRNLYSPNKMKKNKINYFCIGR